MKMRMWVGLCSEIGPVVRAGVRVESLLLCARQDGPSESEVAYLSSPFRRKKKRERKRERDQDFSVARKSTFKDVEMTGNAKNGRGTRREKMEGK